MLRCFILDAWNGTHERENLIQPSVVVVENTVASGGTSWSVSTPTHISGDLAQVGVIKLYWVFYARICLLAIPKLNMTQPDVHAQTKPRPPFTSMVSPVIYPHFMRKIYASATYIIISQPIMSTGILCTRETHVFRLANPLYECLSSILFIHCSLHLHKVILE